MYLSELTLEQYLQVLTALQAPLPPPLQAMEMVLRAAALQRSRSGRSRIRLALAAAVPTPSMILKTCGELLSPWRAIAGHGGKRLPLAKR